MSHIKPQLITAIAETIGITNLHSEAASVLAPDVEYRVRDILQEAIKFTRHAKRAKLSVADINHALQLLDVEVMYGFSKSDTKRYARTTGATDVFYLEEAIHRCDDIIYERLPRAPVEVGVVPHWFLIDGVKPNIPENRPYKQAVRAEAPGPAQAGPAAPAEAVPAPAAVPPPVAEELGQDARATDAASLAAEDRQGQLANLVPVVKHIVSVEQQEYMRVVTEVLLHPPSEAEALSHPIFASLAADEGLEQLLPYLVSMLAAEVQASLKSLPKLRLLLRAAHAIVANRSNNLEKYLHELLPTIMTCLVAKTLGSPRGDHWALRRAAAACLRDVVARFNDPIYSLQPRICKQLVAALMDPRRSLSTHYGALHGLIAFGPQVLQLLVLPLAAKYYNLLLPVLAQTVKLVKRAEAMQCLWALQTAVCMCCRDMVTMASSDALDPVVLRKLHAMTERPSAARRDADRKAEVKAKHLAAMDARIKELKEEEAQAQLLRERLAQMDEERRAAEGEAKAPATPELNQPLSGRVIGVHTPNGSPEPAANGALTPSPATLGLSGEAGRPSTTTSPAGIPPPNPTPPPPIPTRPPGATVDGNRPPTQWPPQGPPSAATHSAQPSPAMGSPVSVHTGAGSVHTNAAHQPHQAGAAAQGVIDLTKPVADGPAPGMASHLHGAGNGLALNAHSAGQQHHSFQDGTLTHAAGQATNGIGGAPGPGSASGFSTAPAAPPDSRQNSAASQQPGLSSQFSPPAASNAYAAANGAANASAVAQASGAVHGMHSPGAASMDVDEARQASGQTAGTTVTTAAGNHSHAHPSGPATSPEGLQQHRKDTDGVGGRNAQSHDKSDAIDLTGADAEKKSPASPSQGAAGGLAPATKPTVTVWDLDEKTVQVLEAGLRGGSEIAQHLSAAYDMFGDAMLPWVPSAPLAHCFI